MNWPSTSWPVQLPVQDVSTLYDPFGPGRPLAEQYPYPPPISVTPGPAPGVPDPFPVFTAKDLKLWLMKNKTLVYAGVGTILFLAFMKKGK